MPLSRRCLPLSLLGLTLFCVGARLVVAAQTPAPTAGGRPNVRVLKNLPESQLYPVMNVIADSLGVRCDYCHVRVSPDPTKTWSLAGGWQWASDDKPTKLVAREMIQMVLDLNATRFNGASGVTCFTCHRGAVRPAATPPLPPRLYDTNDPPPSPPLPSADQIWNNYLKAVGTEAAKKFSSLTMAARDDRSEGRHGTFEAIFKGEFAQFTSRIEPDGTVVQTLTPDGGWVSTPQVTRALRPEELPRSRQVALRYGPVKTERPTDLRVTRVDTIGPRRAFVTTTVIDARTRRELWFDAVSGLLLRDLTITHTLLLPLPSQIDYEDYRTIGGVQVPFRIRFADGAPFATWTRTVTRIQYNVPVDAARFVMPKK